MIRLEAFTPPLINQTTGPFLRPASPQLPQAKPLVQHRKTPAKYQTLPYGIAAVPPPAAVKNVQIVEGLASNESLATNTGLVETQRFLAFEPPRSAESAEITLPVRASLPRYLPLGLVAGAGFLAAYFLFFL